MAEQPPTRGRRNSNLSAYYGLSKSNSNTSETALPQTREQALAHATHLTKTLSLTQLLQHSQKLRKDSEKLQASLHTSIHSVYTNLSAASQAASEARLQAETLLADTSVVSAVQQASKLANDLNKRLAPSRALIDQLEASRTLTLLLTAAKQLTTALPVDYRALVDLCTDPLNAQTRLFRTAARTSMVLSALSSLPDASEPFQSADRLLRDAATAVRDDLSTRSPEDMDALSIEDSIRLRSLLGEQPSLLKQAFFKRAAHTILKERPVVSASALHRAMMHVAFATEDSLRALRAAADTYRSLFGETDAQNDDIWADFVVWTADMAEETVGTRVRSALREADLGDGEGVERCLDALKELEKAAGLVDDVVGEVFVEIAQLLADDLRESVLEVSRRRWRCAVDAVRDADDGRARERMAELMGVVDAGVVDAVGAYVVEHADGVRGCARGAWICRELAAEWRREELADAAKVLADRFRGTVYERIEDMVCVEEVDVDGVVGFVEEAQIVAAECGITVLEIGQGLHEELLGERRGVEAIRVAWTEYVRKGAFSAHEVQSIKGYVAGVGSGIGIDGELDVVGVAAEERRLHDDEQV